MKWFSSSFHNGGFHNVLSIYKFMNKAYSESWKYQSCIEALRESWDREYFSMLELGVRLVWYFYSV